MLYGNPGSVSESISHCPPPPLSALDVYVEGGGRSVLETFLPLMEVVAACGGYCMNGSVYINRPTSTPDQ